MRDEEKTKEQLIEELHGWRRRVRALEAVVTTQASPDDAFQLFAPYLAVLGDDRPELAWDVEGATLPVLEPPRQEEEPSRLLKSGAGRSLPEDFLARNVTETGSFDLNWINLALFGKILHAIPMPIVLVDISGWVQFANNAFLKLSEGTDASPPASLYFLFPEPQDAQQIRELAQQAFAERMPQEREGRLDISGREIWSRMNLRPIRFGTDRSLLVLIEDLTAERRELTLNAKYKRLVDIFPIGIGEFVLEKPASSDFGEDEMLSMLLEARMTDGNEGFARLHGCENQIELKDLPLGSILHPTSTELEFYRRWIHDEFSLIPFETRKISPDATVNYYENTLVGNIREGVLAQFWVMTQDITERKRVQQELEEKIRTIDELYEHIMQSRAAKGMAEHTARVAHELRQPLTIIGGFLRRLARDAASGERQDRQADRQSHEIIIKEIERLERILAGLIDYTRRESVKLSSSNPNDLIVHVLQINEGRMTEKELQVVLNLGEELGAILLDSDRFAEVVRNLVANAIEASEPRGTIRIDTGASIPSDKASKTGQLDAETYFELKIHNQGPAIGPEDVARIFDPFFTTKSYGTGLGLTIARQIVDDHAGSISVRSDDGGTLFTVWLPVRRKEP